MAKKQFANQINFHLYHYAGNNPVRYVDPDGKFIYTMHSYVKMNKGAWNDNKVVLGNSETLISDSGCAITGVANIDTQNKIGRGAKGPAFSITTPLKLNISSNFNTAKGHEDELDWSKIGKSIGLEATRSSTTGSMKEQSSAAQNLVKAAIVSPKGKYLMVQVPITTNRGKLSHWVGVSGAPVDLKGNGESWLLVVGTSKYDDSSRTRNSNWATDAKGNLYVKQSVITGAVTFE